MSSARKTKKATAPALTGAARFYAIIRNIPRGRVTTYGAVAKLAGMPRAARQVGFALARAFGPGASVPWQRVLGSGGRKHARISIADPRGQARQRELLEAEGVRFDARGRVALAEFGWPKPDSSKPGERHRQGRAASASMAANTARASTRRR